MDRTRNSYILFVFIISVYYIWTYKNERNDDQNIQYSLEPKVLIYRKED